MSSSASFSSYIKTPNFLQNSIVEMVQPAGSNVTQYDFAAIKDKSQTRTIPLLPRTTVPTAITNTIPLPIQFNLTGQVPHFLDKIFVGFTITSASASSIVVNMNNLIQQQFFRVNNQQLGAQRSYKSNILHMLNDFTSEEQAGYLLMSGIDPLTFVAGATATIGAGASADFWLLLDEPFSAMQIPTFMDKAQLQVEIQIAGSTVKASGSGLVSELSMSNFMLICAGWDMHPDLLPSYKQQANRPGMFSYSFLNKQEYVINQYSSVSGSQVKFPINNEAVCCYFQVIAQSAASVAGFNSYQSLALSNVDMLYASGLSMSGYGLLGLPSALLRFGLMGAWSRSNVRNIIPFYRYSFSKYPVITEQGAFDSAGKGRGSVFGYQQLDTSSRLFVINGTTTSDMTLTLILATYAMLSVDYTTGKVLIYT